MKTSIRIIYFLAYVTVFIGIWQAYKEVSKVPTYILPSPFEIAVQFLTSYQALAGNALVTVYETVTGFALAAILAVLIAIAVVTISFFRIAVYPSIVAFNSLPKVALAPLLVVWFGLGIESKIVMTLIISFFPIVINTIAGLERIDPDLMYFVKSLGASELDVLRKIRLPHSLPFIFDGLKIAITLAVVGAIVGEFVSAVSGLGNVILIATTSLITTMVFAALFTVTLIAMVLYYIVVISEKLLIRWMPEA